MLTRRSDWSAQLRTLTEIVMYESFAWSTLDCCTFAARAIEAMCGPQPSD